MTFLLIRCKMTESPEIGSVEGTSVGDGIEGGMDEVSKSVGLTPGLGIGITKRSAGFLNDCFRYHHPL